MFLFPYYFGVSIKWNFFQRNILMLKSKDIKNFVNEQDSWYDFFTKIILNIQKKKKNQNFAEEVLNSSKLHIARGKKK
jgi:hypothetical protein